MTTLNDLGIIELEMRIGLDTYHPKVRVTQYDSGLTLEYDIIGRNGEMVASLPDVVPMLYVEAPDKSAIGSAEGKIVDGKAVIPIPSSLLSKFGEAEAQVQLVNSKTKEQIHDNTFILDIAQSKMDGEVSPGESIWFNLQDLKEAIASVQQLEEQYNADVQAVETMKDDVTTKHGEVTTMHSSLQGVFDSEADRVLAEKARADAEKLRASAETTRANDETKRVTAEKNRVTAETGRVDAETTREEAEAEREAQYTKSTDLYSKGSALYSKANPLYTEMKALQEVLGTDPAVELAQAVAALNKTAHPKSAYDFRIGHLVKTNTKVNYGEMVYIRLFYNAYSEGRIREYVGYFYPFLRNKGPEGARLFEIGNSPPIEISILYQANDLVDLWIPPVGTQYPTLFIEVFSSRRPGNQVLSISNTEEPTDVARKSVLPSIKSIPIATTSTDGLYPKEHFSKVGAIPASPKYTDTVYTHPATHPASIITQDSARRMVSDTQINAWNGKVDKDGGQMTGALVVKSTGNTRQARNIAIGTTAPTSTTGYSDGDIFLVVP